MEAENDTLRTDSPARKAAGAHPARRGGQAVTQTNILRMAQAVGLPGAAKDAILQFAALLTPASGGASAKLRKRLSIPDRILLALQTKPLSRRTLEERLGVRRASVTNSLTRLHLDARVHIPHWEKDASGRRDTPMYALGPGGDVVAPAFDKNNSTGRRAATVDLSGATFRTVFAGGANPWLQKVADHA